MKIGIIGAGTVAQTIARHVLPFGHQVMLSNTQGPDSLAPLVKKLGPGAIAGTPQPQHLSDYKLNTADAGVARREGLNGR